MQTQERGEIRQRPERDVGQLPLPQRAGKRISCRSATRRITRRACATEDIRRATKPAREITRHAGRPLHTGISVGAADANDLEFRRTEREQQGERVIDFTPRRTDRRIGINPDRGSSCRLTRR